MYAACGRFSDPASEPPSQEERRPTVFEAVELPAGVADLAAGLADVDGDALALGRVTLPARPGDTKRLRMPVVNVCRVEECGMWLVESAQVGGRQAGDTACGPSNMSHSPLEPPSSSLPPSRSACCCCAAHGLWHRGASCKSSNNVPSKNFKTMTKSFYTQKLLWKML